MTSAASSVQKTNGSQPDAAALQVRVETVSQHVVEVVCDSGEGAQTAGQLFGTICAKLGNGVWTVEIIPAEIEPPHRSRSGASGNRIRIGSSEITNMGDAADVVIAFNEQVLYSRIDVGALRPGTIVFLESKWATDPQPEVQKAYADATADFIERGYVIKEIAMEDECLKVVPDARRGKNMFALGLMCALYERDKAKVLAEVGAKFAKKGEKAIKAELRAGRGRLRLGREEPGHPLPGAGPTDQRRAGGDERQPGRGVGHPRRGHRALLDVPDHAGDVGHPLPGVGNGQSRRLHPPSRGRDRRHRLRHRRVLRGQDRVTVTSGPGLALKTEFIGLAVMAEVPLVIVNVQRGGPSTGLPTRVEQGDLLAALYASPGDTPKIVLAPSTIPECFHFMITARKLAEAFRGPVIVLTDTNLATGQQPFKRPVTQEDWLAPPVDQSDWDGSVAPYAWDPDTGLSTRPIPGQKGGEYVLTGLAHDERSKVAYESAINERAMQRRSRKLATLQKSLKPPKVYGDPDGDLLVVGWGSTRGAIEEAVDRIRSGGGKVSSLTLRFLSPMEPGLTEIFKRFKKVMTVEINYSDDANAPGVTQDNRRYSQLAWLLRAQTLVDIDCWSRVPGIPLPPGEIERELRRRLNVH